MNTKECPLMPRAPCTKEKCAWYLVHSKQCAIPLIASQIQRLAANVIYKGDAKKVKR